ncbi:sensor domain-containing phosphodiesterase [Duganella sp. BJB488]|uniref:sensor domain-containing phosphodiesterase n=1 Tax=unclassified Duganella TaxID=2636909 RepID=UPI000E34192A|nr:MULTISPECIES: GGDEF and EAL domain-containing protein [unclassified Duganella]RFP26074.1 sensor domain-containing phosphodiesterase [Duganella sp. BJB489]RFP28188.1 sensor domain-containing phosphodiesterase [Duganella sp. BJB488]RFP37004.1 sensor domain-containing phosphodiesterase [Duganella sp. BJB480]
MTISCQLTESRRLDALHKLNLLDTPPSEAFDRITRMAASLFQLPIAAVSLTDADRQWFKSRVGVEHTSIPRVRAPCGNVADNAEVLVIPDLLDDPYFRDSPLVASGIRYYAGAPLTTAQGHCLGAMCVFGREPRATTPQELTALCDLAGMVMAQIEMQHAMGRIDPLSGLPNRNQFLEDFQDMQRDRPAGEQGLAVLINLATPEQLSHAARAMDPSYLDELVTDAARWLRAEVGPGRSVYHVTTTQFALIASPGMTLDTYLPLLEARMAHARGAAKSRHVATPTVGVAPFEVGGADCLSVLRQAQCAAHDAIDTRTHVAVYSEAEDTLYQRRFTLLNDFGSALESQDQLRLVYQPRIDIGTGACIGAEALLRWNHPALGAIGPGEFIPMIERSGLAHATTAWVLAAALQQQRRWRDEGICLQMSINVSAANLQEPDFAAVLETGLKQHDLPPDSIELEITESAIMAQPVKAHAMLDTIAATGVRLAIDDFGTGYSSLSYLQRMPADVVKIDQSFVIGLEDDVRKQALVATMITLSQDLGHRVVAEGVECEEVLIFLRQAGCDEAQGFMFARPMEADVFSGWRSVPPGATPGRSTPPHCAHQT